MGALTREQAPAPVLKKELANMASLGGDVIVQGRMLHETLALEQRHMTQCEPREGESDDEANMRAGADLVAHALAYQVRLETGEPVFTADQWQIHGAAHPAEVLKLYQAAERMAGSDAGAIAKNYVPSRNGVLRSPLRFGWVARLRNWARG